MYDRVEIAPGTSQEHMTEIKNLDQRFSEFKN